MTNASHPQQVSVTRLDFLVSNLELRRRDGSWSGPSDSFAYFSGRDKRTKFGWNNAAEGQYDRLRFHVGITPDINHSDSAQYPADHPLNPNLNGLHWGWAGGYVFFALEGRWKKNDGDLERGYSFHLATDRQLMDVELPISLDLSNDAEVRLILDLDRIIGGAAEFSLNETTSSTHSRDGDPLAGRIRKSVESAFRVDGVFPLPATSQTDARRAVEIAPDATPYRLEISRFFPRPNLPLDNPLTEEGVELGRTLFFDPRLSANNSQSCASCHQPLAAFVDRANVVSKGVDGKAGTRNAMPLFNLAWKSSFFWDGRAATLRQQVLQPIENPIEMHESLSNVIAKLGGDGARSPKSVLGSASSNVKAQNYPSLFKRAFGTTEITPDRLARALEQFLLTIVSCDSKFDRVLKGDAQFTTEEQRGFELFHTEYDPRRGQFGADCFHCHGGALFQSQSFANNGLDSAGADLGRYLVTGREGDQAKFSVPSLRNVELTAPYMHDGRFRTLDAVIEHYRTGTKNSATLDPNLAKHPEGGVPLRETDRRALIAFLTTLTDARFWDRRTEARP